MTSVRERPVIVDTGPLVALLVSGESRHQWAVDQFKFLPAPFLTCEAVLAETFHLLRRAPDGARGFFELLKRGVLAVDFAMMAEAEAIERLVDKYRDLPMSLADACLVRMTERHTTGIVLTLDHHFTIYRRHGRQTISTLMPPD